ncbi:hypothetical protein C8Q69DRAFT_297553 [Paecilomyces variotii]|uniref:Uncharacterized protein n=1 Tax=Byssochlamys spectabilis TaxID=264951 RepID=A0A443HS18_BYSSP|nr:hypothetical protein C8Q69DRAFT_297553 [Paecilomyces variotii]KAJ9365450.1 hypothetical protein DTO280E4_419 [Paecilomyces variotii]RWQ94577.1 hypothetical protein C8Q69DRAFT_297553 [Paecilomyces variotii]
MGITQDKVEKIRHFSKRADKLEEEYVREPLNAAVILAYNRRLDNTLEDLKEHVQRQEEALQELRTKRSIDLQSSDTEPRARLAQIRRAKKAYDSLLQTEPELPAPESPLPALIALRETVKHLQETKASISAIAEAVAVDRQRLKAEEVNLRDNQLIASGLEARIEKLQNERSQKEEKTPAQLARELIRTQRRENEKLDQEAEKLKASIYEFIDEHLASMLAAEDVGGPVVGDAVDVPDATLEAGYTHHGKPKKPKTTTTEDEDPRQQRIDTLVRRQRGREGAQDEGPTNKREAAALEMHRLLDSLLEAGSSYIDLPRDSAASRFLVKAKIAQFHHRDARRLRLIDFGRSIDD